jgi:hypothetical protein
MSLFGDSAFPRSGGDGFRIPHWDDIVERHWLTKGDRGRRPRCAHSSYICVAIRSRATTTFLRRFFSGVGPVASSRFNRSELLDQSAMLLLAGTRRRRPCRGWLQPDLANRSRRSVRGNGVSSLPRTPHTPERELQLTVRSANGILFKIAPRSRWFEQATLGLEAKRPL